MREKDHLGVSLIFSREKNLEIIKKRFEENPAKTITQVRFLMRFPKFEHIKGSKFPECKCLGCEGLAILNVNHNHSYKRYNRDYLGEIVEDMKQDGWFKKVMLT